MPPRDVTFQELCDALTCDGTDERTGEIRVAVKTLRGAEAADAEYLLQALASRKPPTQDGRAESLIAAVNRVLSCS